MGEGKWIKKVYKRVPVLVWHDDDIYVEYMVSQMTLEGIKMMNETMGFAPKGVVKDFEALEWSWE